MKIVMNTETLEHELEGIERDLSHTLPFKRGQAHVWGDSQDTWDKWEAELETRRKDCLAKLQGDMKEAKP